MFYAPGKFHRAGGTHWFEGLGDVIRLTIGFGDNPRIQPLKDGTVKPDSIKLEFQASRNLFYHNLAIDDLDCSETDISETILAKERTDGTRWDWTAVPIFLSRAYGWTGILVYDSSGIETLADLKGKRVAVPDYDMTFALWMRCVSGTKGQRIILSRGS